MFVWGNVWERYSPPRCYPLVFSLFYFEFLASKASETRRNIGIAWNKKYLHGTLSLRLEYMTYVARHRRNFTRSSTNIQRTRCLSCLLISYLSSLTSTLFRDKLGKVIQLLLQPNVTSNDVLKFGKEWVSIDPITDPSPYRTSRVFLSP